MHTMRLITMITLFEKNYHNISNWSSYPLKLYVCSFQFYLHLRWQHATCTVADCLFQGVINLDNLDIPLYSIESSTEPSNTSPPWLKKKHRKVFSSHGDQILINFCEVAVESSLTRNITNWHGSCTAWDKKALQRGIKTTQNITGTHPQSISDIGDVRWDVGTEHKGYWKTTRDPDTVCSSCTHPAKLPNVIAVWTVPDISSKVMTKSQKNVLVKSNPTKHEATLHL